ncbi:hypothetical protein QH494_17275 [Sphingomonas sp. AR_OL41]|nr:hypothetical protein [Sphingomonas sp. AR_OL41]
MLPDGVVAATQGRISSQRMPAFRTAEQYGGEDGGNAAVRSRDPNRRFGLSLAALFGVVAIAPLLRSGAPRYLPLCLALLVLALSLLRPHWLDALRRGTNWVSSRIQKVMSPIFLALIYFAIFVPGSLVIRAVFRIDLLRLRADRATASYWIKRDSRAEPTAGMENQY